jgi:hypothetical protein
MLFVKNIKRKNLAESMVEECDSMGLMASDTGAKLAQLASVGRDIAPMFTLLILP